MQWTKTSNPDFERLTAIEAIGAMDIVVEIINGQQKGVLESWHRGTIEGLVRERGEVSDGKFWRVRKFAECVEEGILRLG